MAMDVKTMDIKKGASGSNPGSNPGSTPAHASPTKENTAGAFKLFEFIGDVKEEFHRISWTSPDELRLHTKMVVGATFICGMGIYLVDLCIQSTLHLVSILFHFIFG